MGASVVAGVNAPPVLEPSEHVLDLVPLAIECAIVVDRLLAIGFGRDARRDAAFGKGLAEPASHRLAHAGARPGSLSSKTPQRSLSLSPPWVQPTEPNATKICSSTLEYLRQAGTSG